MSRNRCADNPALAPGAPKDIATIVQRTERAPDLIGPQDTDRPDCRAAFPHLADRFTRDESDVFAVTGNWSSPGYAKIYIALESPVHHRDDLARATRGSPRRAAEERVSGLRETGGVPRLGTNGRHRHRCLACGAGLADEDDKPGERFEPGSAGGDDGMAAGPSRDRRYARTRSPSWRKATLGSTSKQACKDLDSERNGFPVNIAEAKNERGLGAAFSSATAGQRVYSDAVRGLRSLPDRMMF